MNKKAQFANISFVIITTIALSVAFFTLKPLEAQEDLVIGPNQFTILDQYQKTEQALLYLDESAKLVSNQAIFNIANNGGFKEKICGEYKNYSLLSKECYPDYKRNIKTEIKENMDPYITVLNKKTSPDIVIPLDNYEISLIQKENLNIIGTAIKQMTSFLNGHKEGDQIILRYFVYPSFNVELDFNLQEFRDVIDYAVILIDKCSFEEDLNKCITSNIPENWQIGSCEGDSQLFERLQRFCIKSDKKLLINNNKFQYLNPTFKIALDFQKPLI